MHANVTVRPTDALAGMLRGSAVAWNDVGLSPAEFLDVADVHGLTSLLYGCVQRLPREAGWPDRLRDDLARAAFAEAAREIQRQREITGVLDALAREGVRPMLLKGAALVYAVYDAPSLRPRQDTDVFIRDDDVAAVRRVMAMRGYTGAVQCEGELLFGQIEVAKTDGYGVCHAFDFHWRLSTQAVFADVLSYDEIAGAAQSLPALGEHALAAGMPHALVIACIHPAMHHANVERLIWVWDAHLIASRLSACEFEQVAELALAKKVGAVVANQLRACQRMFGTVVPEPVMRRLSSAGPETSADYLQPGRRWHHELASSVRHLPALRDRLRLLREVCFPDPRYMRRAYGLEGRFAGLLLPALYAHRHVHGAWKIVTGRK